MAGDDSKVMRQQVAQLGMVNKPAWINNQQDWPDVYGLPIDNLFGVFGTTWYYDLELPGVKEFVQRYQKMYPDTAMQAPGNVYYNGYMCTKELLSAVERADSTDNIKVIKQLEGIKVSARDRMQHHDAYMGPSHQIQQTVYLATANDEASWKKDKNALFKILSSVEPKEVEDTDAMAACQMESYADTPAYEG